MDDSRNARDSRPEGARVEDEAATGSATGAFGAVPGPEAGAGLKAASAAVPVQVAPAEAKAELVQPVVHRVVVGGNASGKASDYDELLNRLRAGGVAGVGAGERKSADVAKVEAAAVTPVAVEARGPEAAPSVTSKEGFAQLLRGLDAEEAVSSAATRPAEAMRKIEVQTIDLRAPVESVGAAGVVAPSVPAASVPAASVPGTFTQMFQALGAKQEVGVTPAESAPPVSAAGANAAGASAAGAAAPVSFTQMFRAMDAKESVAAGYEVGPVAPPVAAASGAETPGTFTQMFRALDGKSEVAGGGSGAGAPLYVAPAAAAPAVDSPGTFTQLFRTLDSPGSAAPMAPVARVEVAPAVEPRAEGTFTQMLRSQGGSSVPEAKRAAVPAAWDAAPVQSPGGQTWGQVGQSAPEAPRRTEAASGGLTQLLRTLDGPGSATAAARDTSPGMPAAAAPASDGPGMFTQTYQRLEDPVAAAPPAAPVQPMPGYGAPYGGGATGFNLPVQGAVAPAVESGGQSEFTRILDASRMREMGLRGGGATSPGMPQGGGVPAAAPMAMPAMPQPVMPVAPGMPPMAAPPMGGAGYPAAMPGYAPAPMMPPMAAPQMPVMQTPQAPKVAASATGMQKMLPMILIGIIFVLLVVVIALVFMMKR